MIARWLRGWAARRAGLGLLSLSCLVPACSSSDGDTGAVAPSGLAGSGGSSAGASGQAGTGGTGGLGAAGSAGAGHGGAAGKGGAAGTTGGAAGKGGAAGNGGSAGMAGPGGTAGIGGVAGHGGGGGGAGGSAGTSGAGGASCQPGGECQPKSNLCHQGTIQCVVGAATCVDTGSPVADGTACDAAGVCKSGECKTVGACGGIVTLGSLPLVPVGKTAGLQPTAVAAADFDGDGKVDLAVVDNTTLVIHFGAGHLRFPVASSYLLGAVDVDHGIDLVVDDFDGDKRPDVAVLGNGEVAVFLNLGDGTLQASQTLLFATPFTTPRQGLMAAGDIDGDGKPELVVSLDAGGVAVLPNHGTSFGQPAVGTDGSTADALPIAVGDLDGDGKGDVAVGVVEDGKNAIALLRGQSNGALGAPMVIPYAVSGNELPQLSLSDQNGDGKLDILVVGEGYSSKQSIETLLNDGKGGFPQSKLSPVGGKIFDGQPASVLRGGVGDFTGDGIPDVLVHVALRVDGYALFTGSADGSFVGTAAYSAFPIEHQFVPDVAIAIADLDDDGRLDFVVPLPADLNLAPSPGLSPVKNLGGGQFTGQRYIPGKSMVDALAVAVGDVDHDGKPDVVATGGFGLGVYLQKSGGLVATGSGNDADLFGGNLAVADLDGDGFGDVVAMDAWGFAVSLNDGTGTFPPPTVYGETENFEDFRIADLDADGILDIVTSTTSKGLRVFLGEGKGVFGAGTPLVVGKNAGILFAFGDFDDDGKLDLVTIEGSVDLELRLGDGKGGFAAPSMTWAPPGKYVSALLAADVDGDQKTDLVIAAPNGQIDVFRQSGGKLVPGKTAPGFSNGNALSSGDFDGDGHLDVIVGGGAQLLSLFRGDGAGAMSFAGDYPAVNPRSIGVGDFDGDGRPDVVLPAYVTTDIGTPGLLVMPAGCLPLEASIQSPMLILQGDHDFVRMEHSAEIVRLIPRAEVAVIPSASHFALSSEPERVIPIIQHFLEKPDEQLPLATAGRGYHPGETR